MLEITELILAIYCIRYIWLRTASKMFPSPQFIFAFAYFAYIYFGYILMHWDPYYMDLEGFKSVGVLIRIGFISIVIASLLTFRLKSTRYVLYINPMNSQENKSNNSWNIFFYTILGFAFIGVAILYLAVIPANPLRSLLDNSALLDFDREAATTGFKSFGFYSNVFYNLMPLCWLSLYVLGERRYWKIIFLVNVLVTLATGQKSPIVYILILFILANGIRKKEFSYVTAIKFGLIAFLILILIVLLQNMHIYYVLDMDAIYHSISGLSRRVFYVGPLTLFNYFQTFPAYHPFLMDEAASMPSDQIVYRSIYGTQIQGTVNTVSLGIFYAWTGNIITTSILFFILTVCIFCIPMLFKFFSSDAGLYRSTYIAYGLLLIKLVITDWYTLIPFFILSFFVMSGLNHLMYQIIMVVLNGSFRMRCNKFAFIVTVISLAYFIQGQVKILFG